jgi:hypothetical protein
VNGLWSNPELVRHVRAELRPVRAASAAAVTGVVLLLIWLAARNAGPQKVAIAVFGSVVGLQFVFGALWCALTCGNALSKERVQRTFDFLRTTRLTASELVTGKLLGEPVLGYFVLACSLPLSLAAGWAAGFSMAVWLQITLLLASFSLLVAVVSLWLSMLSDRGGLAVVLGLFFALWSIAWPGSPFPAVAALFPYVPVVVVLSDGRGIPPATVFGYNVGYFAAGLLLHVTLGAWFFLMLARNLKKGLDQMRLLSRWQAVGLAAYVNLLYHAFLNLERPGMAAVASQGAVILNGTLLFACGTAMLTPYEALKVWQRRHDEGRASYFSEDGLSWPWLVWVAGAGLVMLALRAATSGIPRGSWNVATAAAQMAIFLVFAIRDVTFLQYCGLTRMKSPLTKGFLYLLLYYVAVGIAATLPDPAGALLAGLMPFTAVKSQVPFASYLGAVAQIPMIILLLQAISHQLRRPVIMARASAA